MQIQRDGRETESGLIPMNVGDTAATGGAKCAMLQATNEWVSHWTHRPHVYLFNTGIVSTEGGAGKVPLKCQDDENDR